MSDEEIEMAQKGEVQREMNNMLLKWILTVCSIVGTGLLGGVGTVAWVGINDHFRVGVMDGKIDTLTILMSKQSERAETKMDGNLAKISELQEFERETRMSTRDRATLADVKRHDYEAQQALNEAGLKIKWPITTHEP